jgi:hypothetical protein
VVPNLPRRRLLLETLIGKAKGSACAREAPPSPLLGRDRDKPRNPPFPPEQVDREARLALDWLARSRLPLGAALTQVARFFPAGLRTVCLADPRRRRWAEDHLGQFGDVQERG